MKTQELDSPVSSPATGEVVPVQPINGDGQPPHHEEVIPKDLKKASPWAVAAMTIVFLAMLAGLFVLGYLPYLKEHQQAQEDAQVRKDEKLTVGVSHPRVAQATSSLRLPCDVRPNQTTAIYPRATGYLGKLLHDIGDEVKGGELLALVETPDIDAQLNQSKAALDQAKANAVKAQSDQDLAELTLKRYQDSAGSVAQQSIDERKAAYDQAVAAMKQAVANIAAADADVARLTTLQSFERIEAPFDGVITNRNYDRGALMIPTNIGPNLELLDIAQTDPMRVFVSVPQTSATGIKIGQEASLTVSNYPGHTFTGQVARTANSMDINTRTMQVEVHFHNTDKEHMLYAGMYGDLSMDLAWPANKAVIIPVSAVIFNQNGMQVALVRDGTVHMQKIDPGRDMGTEMEVLTALTKDDSIIVSPSSHLQDGLAVEAVSTDKAPEAPPSRAAAK